jgi:hypothetical protein
MPAEREVRVTRRDFVCAAGVGTALASFARTSLSQSKAAIPIPLRAFGMTGVKVPILGVGTAPAGFRGRKEAANLFGECLDRGLYYFDTAPEFAGYASAQVGLGDVLRTRRQEAFVVTKCWEPDGEKAIALLQANLRELQPCIRRPAGIRPGDRDRRSVRSSTFLSITSTSTAASD